MGSRITRFSPVVAVGLVAALTTCREQPSGPKLPPTSQAVAIMPGVPTVILSHVEPAASAAAAARSAGGVTVQAATGPVQFRRTPGEGGSWVDMAVGGTAYFRDVAWEATYTIEATDDGDYWDSNISFPGGGGAQFPRITYYKNYGGETDCFVVGFQSLCGATTASVEDILSIQCQATGTYTYELFQNGGRVFSGTFFLKPTLPPGTWTSYNQNAFPGDPYNTLCYISDSSGDSHDCAPGGTEKKVSIATKGCALTAAAMVLSYFGIPIDPKALNDYLVGLDDGGYTSDGYVNWQGVLARAGQDNVRLGFEKTDPGTVSAADLRNRICRFGPQIVQVTNKKGGTHFVMVTGLNDAGTDFTIADPASGGNTSLRDTYGDFVSVREFEPTSQPDWDAVLSADAHSPVQLLLTDPLGRITGYDPVRGQDYSEIPSSAYDSSGLETLLDDGSGVQIDPLWKELDVRQAVDGDYTLAVTGTAAGTYRLNVRGYDRLHRHSSFVVSDVPIGQGEVHQYGIHFNSADMSAGTLPISGGFAGGGQRSDVNALLSYARPGDSRTSLPLGTTTYSLMIFYDVAIDAATFQAELNGVPVESLFHPVPGTNEVVTIALEPGRNVLKLLVTGSPGGRSGTDRDHLVFLVE